MKYRRPGIIILSTILVIIFGGMAIVWLNDKCPSMSQRDCKLMWGTMFASIVGGIFFAEMLFASQKTQGEWPAQTQDSQNFNDIQANESDSNWYVWFRPIAWVTLSILLGGLPLIVQGAVALTISGIAIGFCLDGLIRGIMNRLPPMNRESK